MDKLDYECADAFGRISSGEMSLAEFISWVADQCAEAFGDGRASAADETQALTGTQKYQEHSRGPVARITTHRLESPET